jgi:orotate phosphoribosyltransferase
MKGSKKELIERVHKHRDVVQISDKPFEVNNFYTMVFLNIDAISKYLRLSKALKGQMADFIEDECLSFDFIVEDRESSLMLANFLGSSLEKPSGSFGEDGKFSIQYPDGPVVIHPDYDFAGQKVLLVDPAAGEGAGSIELLEKVRKMGGNVSDFAVLYYWQAGAKRKLKDADVKLHHYLTGEEVFDPSHGFIPPTYISELAIFFNDRKKWHDRHGLPYNE